MRSLQAPVRKVVDVEPKNTKAGHMLLLILDCGHTKLRKPTDLGQPRRARCRACWEKQ